MSLRPQSEPEITALLIAPDRALAGKLLATLPQTHAFQILADLKSYPQPQTLEIRVRQLKPAVILLDLASDPAQALDLIRFASALPQPVLMVGLHTNNDSQAILQSLRALHFLLLRELDPPLLGAVFCSAWMSFWSSFFRN